MQIELLLFGILNDVIGESSIQLDLSNYKTIVELKVFLLEKYPKLNDYRSFSVAVNQTYVEDSYQLNENDIVALIPPVSGG